MIKYKSWGYIPDIEQESVRPPWGDFSLKDIDAESLLPYGNGRSYGDSCLNTKGVVVDNRLLNHFIDFDRTTGVLKCEAGILFADILKLIVPENWFLPVTPGTKYITLGGAIANDVHGKNHHQDGTFGRHILSFELMRSNGDTLICSVEQNTEFFAATIGGLGLTGFIRWAEIQLIRVPSPYIKVETTSFHGLEEFYALSEEANNQHQYSVAWIDCASQGKNFARGLFMEGDHDSHNKISKATPTKPKISVPFNFPQKLLNRYTIRAFNALYFHKNRLFNTGTTYQYYDSFFYPLDGLGNWNRVYGKRGFYQYQFVVPLSEKTTMTKILNKIVESGLGSFLAVLKVFGNAESPGTLSFPRPGICLALDFANRGDITLDLIDTLDKLVIQAGGSVYPAKDIRMSSTAFKSYYPQFKSFKKYIDPKFSSDFWRRVTNEE